MEGWSLGQLLLDGQGRAILGLGLRLALSASDSRLPRLLWLIARLAVELAVGRVILGQLPLDGQRRAVLGPRLRRVARRRQQTAEVVMAACQHARKSSTAGFSSVSLCWIEIAGRYSASASDVLARTTSRLARLLWRFARLLRNSATVGLSSASLCWIASAVRYSFSASLASPVLPAPLPSQLVVTARSFAVRSVAAAAAASAAWSARAMRSIDRAQRCGRSLSIASQPAPAEREPARTAAAEGAGPAGPASRNSASRYAASASSVLPVNSSSRPMAVRLWPTSARPHRPTRLRRQRLPAASTLRCAARLPRAADQTGQRGHLKVRTCQAIPRPVRLPSQ